MDPTLDMLCKQIATILAQKRVPGRSDAEALPSISNCIAYHLHSITSEVSPNGSTLTPMALTPELMEWARNQFSDEEAVAGLREIRETGGLTFEDVIRGLEPPASHE
jgi:hypothetical protein